MAVKIIIIILIIILIITIGPNNNAQEDSVYGAVIMKVIATFHLVYLTNVGQRLAAAYPQTSSSSSYCL